MTRFVVVELDDATQEFFESTYDAFKFAKDTEDARRHSVEYIAVGEFYTEEGIVYRGNELRHILRTLDVYSWVKAGCQG